MDATINKKRLAIIFFLGFSSGLPLALTGATLQAWFTTAGISIVAIGSLSLVGQPYVYKFFWAPLFDRYTLPFLGRRRGWLLLTQVGLLFSIAAMAAFNPQQSPYILGGLALLVAFLSASQDIAFDAYRTDLLDPNERGIGAALTTGGYRIAMMVSGGLGLVLADFLGWHITYLIMALLMIIGMVTTWFSTEPDFANTGIKAPITLRSATIDPLREFFSRKAAVGLLLFIVLYKIGDALSLSLATPFLIRGLGFSLSVVGATFKGVGLITAMLGIFVGGLIMARLSLFRSLFLFGILQIVAILFLMELAIVGKNYSLLVAAISADSFFNGLGTTALVVYMMSLCDHRYTAMQFALLSAFSAIGRVFIGPIAGIMVEHIGWVSFFAWSIIASIPGLLLLWWLREKIEFTAQQSATSRALPAGELTK